MCVVISYWVFWSVPMFMGKISSCEVMLSCGEPGQTPVGDGKEKEHHSFSAGNCHFFTIPWTLIIFDWHFCGVWFVLLWILLVTDQAVDLPSTQDVLDHKCTLLQSLWWILKYSVSSHVNTLFPSLYLFFFFTSQWYNLVKCCYFGRKHLHFLNQNQNTAISEKHFSFFFFFLYIYFCEHVDNMW